MYDKKSIISLRMRWALVRNLSPRMFVGGLAARSNDVNIGLNLDFIKQNFKF